MLIAGTKPGDRWYRERLLLIIAGYEAIIEHFRAELPINVYSRIIKTTARGKLTALRQFVSNG